MAQPGDFPGGPVVKTPRFHCSRRGFDPWLGNWDPTCLVAQPKNKNKNKFFKKNNIEKKF